MALHVFSGVFASVLDTCFKCFICLWIYVANVLSGYFKNRLDVAHVAMALAASGQRPGQGFSSYLTQRASPSPLLSLPSLPFSPSRLGVDVGIGVGVIEGAAFRRRHWRGMQCGACGRGMRCMARGHGMRCRRRCGSSGRTSRR
jgi:hypothetical protein